MSDSPSISSAGTRDREGLFVGRADERRRLAECAGRVRNGDAWLAVVEGEAGIGKSTLVRHLASTLSDFTILSAIGDQSETEFPGGVCGQLTQRVDREVLSSFPLLADAASAGLPPHAIGGQLLLLLGALQEARGPVAVIVDDVQWADALSMQTLGFVLRRLWADRVLVVMVTRSDQDNVSEMDRLIRSLERTVHLKVGGLDDSEVAELVKGLTDAPPTPPLIRRLRAYAHGHPLYVRTVLSEVPVETLRDDALDRWPVPRSLLVGIKDQMDRLPPESVELLEAMAVLDTRLPLATVAQLTQLADPARALGPALSAGLAVWWPTESQSPVALVHALQRDAVYDAIDPERRRALHAGAAALVGPAASWAHRVAAADSVDAALAAELEASAMGEAATGRNALAATRLLWASALSESREDRERRLLTACAQSLVTMQPVAAAKLRAEVEDCAPGALRSCVLGGLDMLDNRLVEAEARLAEAWEQARTDPGSGWLAVLAGTFLTVLMMRNVRGAETAAVAAQTLAVGDLDPATTDFTRAVMATGRMWDQGPRVALADLGHLPAEASAATNHQLDTLATRGVMRLFLGDLEAARRDLALVARRDQQGAGSRLSQFSLSLLAVADYLSGDWTASQSAAEQALAIVAVQGNVLGDAAAEFAAVCVHAGSGRWDDARRHVDTLSHLTQMIGTPVELVYGVLAEATVAQARADYGAMLRALRPALDDRDRADAGGEVRVRYEPFWLWQQSLLVEGLVGTEQLDHAARALDELRARHDGTGYLEVVVARLAGRLAEAQGRPRDALKIYEKVLSQTPDPTNPSASAPLHQAMLEQAHGRLLAATGAAPRREAARWLRTAHDRFSTLRATPFLERCEADLSAIGLAAPAGTATRVLALTEREMSVAYLIADGRTNREAAAELYVSPKAVEYHLSNIYAKLGISSRRQLAEALRTQQPPPSGRPDAD
ncbi:transcriptional regulator, LuxR family [Catenulispora acidiphila DSM 44928]|uniref:Transcriptional regulator, LuxR family n=1 Tax=Catenulispora acidiphila (strain DSM 44928 / JCM 14897 / NBRC 102108 / NRRL B-24433 / ID139908) TaxID=479433 RepID=C7QAL5_CATAD|nr:LuxR family transcriptional regulator [Catenulispora acidiphila]ACU72514.1 transcriptional regulator, LuxR family [Catenulispora acidiphila DSM 44928]